MLRRFFVPVLTLVLLTLVGWYLFGTREIAPPLVSKPPADGGTLKSSPPNLKPAPTAAPAVFGTREANPEVKAQPTPYIAPQKPADLAATTERARLLQDARILQERATPPDAQGNFTKKRVVEAKFKYPFLRIEESWKRDAATGVETMQEQKVMVADHFLLTLKDGVTAGELKTVLDGLGGNDAMGFEGLFPGPHQGGLTGRVRAGSRVRVGIAAMRVVRPLPFAALPQPMVKDFIPELANVLNAEKRNPL